MDRRTAHTKTDPKLNNTAPVALKNKKQYILYVYVYVYYMYTILWMYVYTILKY